MNLDDALKAHADWKVKLRLAIRDQQKLDAATLSSDNACAFGKWLHGEARTQYGKLRSYAVCLEKHAAFHKEAGKVATLINAGQFDKATAALEGGTPYAATSSAVGGAILGLRKETAPA